MQRHLHLLAGFLVISLSAFGLDLGTPPAGFTWERLTEIKAAALRPTGWTLKHERKGDSEAYTLNAPKSAGPTPPAFALNWVRDVPGKAKMAPSAYAAALADAASDSHKLLDRAAGKQGTLATLSFRFLDNAPGREGTMVRYQFFANDQTGSLYITAFEAPAKEWDAAWKTGSAIFESLRFDPAQ
jgi:hypothetical protein